MPQFTANADYEENDSKPLQLMPGDWVETGVADTAWPGWIWVKSASGGSGYVPMDVLSDIESDRAQVTECFDATVLAVRRGDPVESLRQIHGWHWCQNGQGMQGWVPGYLLNPA
ncbi:MAG: hypothetical protein ACO3RV_07980 [Luteolibacter sp.]